MRDAFNPKEKGFLGREELQSCFQGVGYPITSDDVAAIFSDCGLDENPNGKLEVKLLYERLSCWKDVLARGSPEKIAGLQMELLEVRG